MLGKIVALSDVEGTIIEEGIKAQAIMDLEKSLLAGVKMLSELGVVSVYDHLNSSWEIAKNDILEDEKYFGRFFKDSSTAKETGPIGQYNVIFEAMKIHGKEFAKLISAIMLNGVIGGKYEVIQNEDVVTSLFEMSNHGINIGTYSGGSDILQEAMLSHVYLPRSNLFGHITLKDIVTCGGGFHDKKEFGNKLKADSYLAAASHFAEQGQEMGYWLTDSIGEAQACQTAVRSKPASFNSEMKVYLIDRKIKDNEVTSEGIIVVPKFRYDNEI